MSDDGSGSDDQDYRTPPPESEPVQHVSVKPPAFSTASVKRWFTILESQFTLARITRDATKCCYVISSLPVEILDKVPDDVISSNVYATLKNNIIDLFVKPQPQQFNDLIQNNPLNTRPTLYLQQLRTLGSTFNLTDDFLKIQFLNNMPLAIRSNLVTHQGSLDDIARTADTLLAYNYNSPGFNYVQNQPSSSFMQNSDNSVAYHVSNQSRSNYNPKFSNNSYKFIDYSSENVPKNVRAFNNKQKPKICSYHIYYGNNAKRCKPYCILNNPSLQTLPDSRPSSRSSSPTPVKHNNPTN